MIKHISVPHRWYLIIKDNKDLYGKIEQLLDPTIAGSEASTLDKETLSTLNDKLTDALKELDNKTK